MKTSLQLLQQRLLLPVKSQTGKETDGVMTWTTWLLAIMMVATVVETTSRLIIAPNVNVWIPTTLPQPPLPLLLLPLVLTITHPTAPTGLPRATVPRLMSLLWPSIARNLAMFVELKENWCYNKLAKGHCLLVLLYLSILWYMYQ